MANLNGFDANEVEPVVGFEVLPAGRYLVAITESKMKPTQSGDGQFLQLTFQVLEGDHKGRLLWSRLNLDNKNSTAVRIARAELSAVCRAVGVMAPRDSCELHALPLIVRVGQKRRQDTNELVNEIRGYEKKGAAAAPAAAVPGNNGTPPWKR